MPTKLGRLKEEKCRPSEKFPILLGFSTRGGVHAVQFYKEAIDLLGKSSVADTLNEFPIQALHESPIHWAEVVLEEFEVGRYAKAGG